MTAGDVSAPPIDFPVYGMDPSWAGTRWLDYYQGKVGDPVWSVGLGHLSAGHAGGVVVSTLRREHYDTVAARMGVDPLAEVALDGAIRLGDAGLPVREVPRPPGLLRALVDHMSRQAQRCRDWPVVTWRLDGEPITAPVLRFADGWLTCTDAPRDGYLTVVGIGVPLSPSLHVTRADLREYGVDPAVRLSPALLAEARPAVGLPVSTSLHADLRALVA